MTLYFEDLTITVPMEISKTVTRDSWTVTLHTPHGRLHLEGTSALTLTTLRHEIDSLIRALGYESEIAA